jgi:hypothetical protein
VECEFGSRLQAKAPEHRHRLGLYGNESVLWN